MTAPHQRLRIAVLVVALASVASCADQKPPASPSLTPPAGTTSPSSGPSNPDASSQTAVPPSAAPPAEPAPLGWIRAGKIPEGGSASSVLSFADGYVAWGTQGDEIDAAAWFSADGQAWRQVDFGEQPTCLGSGPSIVTAVAAPSGVLLITNEPDASLAGCGWHLVAWTTTNGTTWQASRLSDATGQGGVVAWWTSGAYEAIVRDSRGAGRLWRSDDGSTWTINHEIDFISELDSITGTADAAGTRLLSVSTGDIDPVTGALYASKDGGTWARVSEPGTDADVIDGLTPPGDGHSFWVATTTDQETPRQTIWVSSDLKNWTAGALGFEAAGVIVPTSHGLLALGHDVCIDTGTACELRPREYLLSRDGLDWRPLGTMDVAEVFADGPAGVVGVDAIGSAVWRLERLTEDEVFLVAGLRPDVRGRCAPRRDGLPARAVAGVTCRPSAGGVDEVGAYLFERAGDLQAAYRDRMAEAGIELGSGSCPTGPGETAYVPEALGTIGPFRIGCFRNEFGNANLRLTAPDSLVYIGVLGTGPDIKAIWNWAWGGNQDQLGSPTIWREPSS